jgi:hypothetical protein
LQHRLRYWQPYGRFQRADGVNCLHVEASVQKFLGGVALMAAAMVATPSAAVEVFLQTAGIYDPGHVLATVPGGPRDEYSVPVHFTGNFGTSAASPTFDFDGFCIDLFHNINVGFGSQAYVGLNYHVAPLTTDGVGNPLSLSQVRQIGGLANLGFGLIGSSDPDKAAKLAAIQAAIWTVEYPAISFTAYNSFAGLQGYIDSYVALAPTLSGYARVIYSDLPGDSARQGFITTVPGVPEPAVWAQMIAGFVLAGSVVRMRRRAIAA